MSERLPVGKRRNTFTGELVDEKPLSIAPSPADQRVLAATGDKPLIELCKEVVDSPDVSDARQKKVEKSVAKAEKEVTNA